MSLEAACNMIKNPELVNGYLVSVSLVKKRAKKKSANYISRAEVKVAKARDSYMSCWREWGKGGL